MVQRFIEDWGALAHLYQIVLSFAESVKGQSLIYSSLNFITLDSTFGLLLNADTGCFQGGIEIKSYSYKKLCLAYGPNKSYTVRKLRVPQLLPLIGPPFHHQCFPPQVTIYYQMSDRQFHLSFGTCGPAPVANCHTLMAIHLQKDLNTSGSLAELAQVSTMLQKPPEAT